MSSSHPEDVKPSFADKSIAIRSSESKATWILGSPTEEDKIWFLDELCHAGCILDDILDHFKLSGSSPKLPKSIRLGRPTSSRTETSADIVALKVASSDDRMIQLVDEVQFLLNLQHPGIVRAYGMYAVKAEGKRSLGMLLDYKKDGDFEQVIPPEGLPEDEVRGCMAQVCNALGYLHGLSAVHRDLKPSNVLREMAEDGSVKAILADFGLAAHVNDTKKIANRCGTGGFIAPEMFRVDWETKGSTQAANVITKIDIFSFGMLVYTMAYGSNPFIKGDESQNIIYKRNARGLLSMTSLAGRSDELQSLILGLCAQNPLLRYSSQEALAHPWFR
jgi:calcium/calmodulin-dependent protein kinase I